MRKNRSCFLVFPLLAALIVCLFAGCGASAKDSAAPAYTMAASTTAAAAYMPENAMGADFNYSSTETETGSGSIFVPADQRKIIRSANLYVLTEDYAASYEALTGKLAACGGYIEQINTSGSAEYFDRFANMTLRVPAEQLDAFLDSSDSFGTVSNLEIWQEDVTFSYTDMETRLATLETKRDRLLSMLEKATEMTDIIELETALSDTIYEIERYTANLRVLADQIGYSTVTLTLRERLEVDPIQTAPKTLGEKIAARFGETMEGLGDFGEELLIFVIGASPVLLILAVIVVVIVMIVRKSMKKSRDKYNQYLAEYRKDLPKNEEAPEKKEDDKND